jgi:5-(carboxyamino)imidazole ribonucleotide synthase
MNGHHESTRSGDPLQTGGTTIGVVGGGQLGRMLGEAAAPLGLEVVVLDPSPDPPAAPVVRDHVQAAFDDTEAIRALGERVDVLTVEIELADPDALAAVERDGTPVHPAPDTVRMTRDKLVEKRRLADAGIPVPDFRAVDDPADLREAIEVLGPVMLKARRGGYDGRGNLPVRDPAEAAEAMDAIAGPGVAEALLDFDREIAVMGARGRDGTRTFPPTETIHREEILRETISPARVDAAVRERARAVAEDVLGVLDGRGVFGIELFEVDGEILVNEIAPRPHNSGHWTIEGCVTSQFEQHARAVAGRPLGATDRRAPTASANILGDVDEERSVVPVVGAREGDPSSGDGEPTALYGVDAVLDTPRTYLHWYGKRTVRPLRKMGHVTATGGDPGDAHSTATRLRDQLTFANSG